MTKRTTGRMTRCSTLALATAIVSRSPWSRCQPAMLGMSAPEWSVYMRDDLQVDRDPLTELLNHRAFYEALELQHARALETGERRLAWLSRVDHVLVNLKGWRRLLPPRWRRTWELQMLQRHGLFNSKAYLNRYPDIAAVGMDPLEHYILHGMHEGRTADGPASYLE